MTRRKLIAGNWKMNGVAGALGEIGDVAMLAANNPGVDVALCLPATLIERACRSAPGLTIGAQDCHAAESGAHTGCISAAMLADAGAALTIVGHSERRAGQCENDADVKAKAETALRAGLSVILCVGESEVQRDAGQAVAVVCAMLDASLPAAEFVTAAGPERFAVAYEPIWAIGTGRIPTMDDVAAMHAGLRKRLRVAYGSTGEALCILYGGSMTGDNAADLLAVADVDGGLIGGASLTVAKFAPIVEAAAAAGGR